MTNAKRYRLDLTQHAERLAWTWEITVREDGGYRIYETEVEHATDEDAKADADAHAAHLGLGTLGFLFTHSAATALRKAA